MRLAMDLINPSHYNYNLYIPAASVVPFLRVMNPTTRGVPQSSEFPMHPTPLQAQRPPHALLDLPIVLFPVVAPHLGGVDVSGALVVGLGQQVHDGQQDLLDGLDGRPALRGVLVVVGVVAGGVEDGDADQTARVDWQEDVCVSGSRS